MTGNPYSNTGSTHSNTGSTLCPSDIPRLKSQLERVRMLMIDGRPRTLETIAHECHASQASASARLRELRGMGYTVDRKATGIRGLFNYVVTNPTPQQLKFQECA